MYLILHSPCALDLHKTKIDIAIPLVIVYDHIYNTYWNNENETDFLFLNFIFTDSYIFI